MAANLIILPQPGSRGHGVARSHEQFIHVIDNYSRM